MSCLNGIGANTDHDDRNCLARIFCREKWRVASRYHDDIDLETHQIGGKLTDSIELRLCVTVLGDQVLSFYIAKLAKRALKWLGTWVGGMRERR